LESTFENIKSPVQKVQGRKHNARLLPSRLYCWYRSFTGSTAFAGRGLYRQWGLTPRPEEHSFLRY